MGLPFPFTMGRRGRKKAPVQESGPWMQASVQRLSQHRAIRQDASSGVSQETFVELGTRPRRATAAGEPVAPAEREPEYRTSEEVMAMVHRGGAEGLQPSGFSPDRHTVYICGRPVQVLEESHESFKGSCQQAWNLSIFPACLNVRPESTHVSKSDFVSEDDQGEIESVAISGE